MAIGKLSPFPTAQERHKAALHEAHHAPRQRHQCPGMPTAAGGQAELSLPPTPTSSPPGMRQPPQMEVTNSI